MGSWQEPLAPYQHVTYWHTIYYSNETKTNICQEGRKLRAFSRWRKQLRSFVMTCIAIEVSFFERHRNLTRYHLPFICSGQCHISVVSHGNNSSSKHGWPAGAVGAVRPVGAILPTAIAAGPCRSRAADGYAAPKAPAGIKCPKFLWFKNYKWSGFWRHKNLKIITEI